MYINIYICTSMSIHYCRKLGILCLGARQLGINPFQHIIWLVAFVLVFHCSHWPRAPARRREDVCVCVCVCVCVRESRTASINGSKSCGSWHLSLYFTARSVPAWGEERGERGGAVHLHANVYVYIQIYIYIYICLYIWIYIYPYVYICIYTHTYIYIYTYMYIYVYTHTHIYIYIYVYIYVYIGRSQKAECA